jgi:hypothetical protein
VAAQELARPRGAAAHRGAGLLGGGLYTLKHPVVVTRSLQPPGSVSTLETWNVISWFQSLLFLLFCVYRYASELELESGEVGLWTLNQVDP